ncbi:uncharacterized protein LOC117431374 isoform X3 [Acipenser ruthenus]|uniref:uncharacterized protein LOC117431374 isoform X3 n=1 Tax=Acipenser ruthenus TaxID=7906 RepID=UPI00145B46B1|nr:uncharacterized protein LOC117431374 isoform X3 [Acipenser ruthenus]
MADWKTSSVGWRIKAGTLHAGNSGTRLKRRYCLPESRGGAAVPRGKQGSRCRLQCWRGGCCPPECRRERCCRRWNTQGRTAGRLTERLGSCVCGKHWHYVVYCPHLMEEQQLEILKLWSALVARWGATAAAAAAAPSVCPPMRTALELQPARMGRPVLEHYHAALIYSLLGVCLSVLLCTLSLAVFMMLRKRGELCPRKKASGHTPASSKGTREQMLTSYQPLEDKCQPCGCPL